MTAGPTFRKREDNGAFRAAWLVALIVSATVLVGCAGSPFVRASPTPPHASLINTDPRCRGVKLSRDRTVEHIAVYTWRRAGSTYVPQATGLDGSLATGAKFNPQAIGPNDRSIAVTFNAAGQDLLDKVTAAVAVPGGATTDSPDHHLAVFLGLTNEQVANWANPAVQQKAMTPVEQGGNLLSNGAVIQPFMGNQLIVYFGDDLVTSCSLTAGTTGPSSGSGRSATPAATPIPGSSA